MSWEADVKATKSARMARPHCMLGRTECHGKNGEKKSNLRGDHPASASAEPWRHIAVHQWGPKELERVRKAHQGEDADSTKVYTDHRHPCLERTAREGQRQARRKSENKHHADAPASVDFKIRTEVNSHGIARICLLLTFSLVPWAWLSKDMTQFSRLQFIDSTLLIGPGSFHWFNWFH